MTAKLGENIGRKTIKENRKSHIWRKIAKEMLFYIQWGVESGEIERGCHGIAEEKNFRAGVPLH